MHDNLEERKTVSDKRPFATYRTPSWDPKAGSQHYLPDDDYLYPVARMSLNDAIRLVACCIARFSDQYRARWLFDPSGAERHGWLPEEPDRREAAVDVIMTWLAGHGLLTEAGLVLLHGDDVLLEGYDGLPGLLTLTSLQYAELCVYLTEHGLPGDLYYPISDQVVIPQPAQVHGGVAVIMQRFSPRSWKNRPADTPLPVPSDEDRDRAFLEASSTYLQAIKLRLLELSEPGKAHDEAQVNELRELHHHVIAAIARVSRRRLGNAVDSTGA